MKFLNELDLQPKLLFANHYVGMNRPQYNALEERFIYDYEIELITEVSNGYMIQNGHELSLKKGDILFRRPNEITQGFNRYNSYIICFLAHGKPRTLPLPYQLETIKTFQEPVNHILLSDALKSFNTNHYERYLTSLKSIYNAYISPHPSTQIYTSALIVEILYHLNKEIHAISNPSHPKANIIRAVLNYIEAHLHEDLSLDALSNTFDYSSIYFHQLFKEITGITLSIYVTEKRLEAAKELLVHSEDSIKSICYDVGFHNSSYFSSVFSKRTGFTPKSYRNTYRITYN